MNPLLSCLLIDLSDVCRGGSLIHANDRSDGGDSPDSDSQE
jgi:hypothetical protein